MFPAAVSVERDDIKSKRRSGVVRGKLERLCSICYDRLQHSRSPCAGKKSVPRNAAALRADQVGSPPALHGSPCPLCRQSRLVIWSSMISEPSRGENPRTGVPHAIASIMTSPKWFGPIDWKEQRECVAGEIFAFAAIADLSDELNAGAAKQWRDYLAKIGFIHFVDICLVPLLVADPARWRWRSLDQALWGEMRPRKAK